MKIPQILTLILDYGIGYRLVRLSLVPVIAGLRKIILYIGKYLIYQINISNYSSKQG